MSSTNTSGAQPATSATPTSHNRTVGARGESIAAAYLEGLGYRILDRNWYSRYGELDLVAAEGDTLVAVEVKTRTGLGYGHPLQAITQRKADRLRRLLLDWCRSSEANAAGGGAAGVDSPGGPKPQGDPGPWRQPRPWWSQLRVDAIGIVLRPGVSPSIDHLQGIS